MSVFSRMLVGSAGLAMIAAAAAPAAAQTYYPPPPPPPYQQGYGQGGVVGQVIDQVLGGGRYGAYGQGRERMQVDQCARAAEFRVNRDMRDGSYNQGYSSQGYGNQGYGTQGYGHAYGRAQVVGITGVNRARNGLVRVSGVIDTRMGYNQGQYGQYGQAYGQYGQPYPGQGYPNPGYGNPGYGNQAYAIQNADLRFSCRVDQQGRITDLDIRRNRGRGY